MKAERKIALFRFALFAALAAIFAGLTGCQTAHVKTPEWEASINSHWFKRDVDKLSVQRQADGSYTLDLNGYKGDASEQLPAFTREMWSGLAILGRIAATAVNPAASAVPLTQEPANAADVAALVKATNDAKVALANAKAELAKAKASSATSGSSSDCTDGSCERK